MTTQSSSQYTLQPWLTPVRLVAISNQTGTYYNGDTNSGVGATFTYPTGVLTIDSVVVNFGDRILLADQNSAFQNGIYVCKQAGAVGVSAILQRSADQQCLEQIMPGFYVPIDAGTLNAGDMYVLLEPRPAALGINDVIWSSVNAGGSGVQAIAPILTHAIASFYNTTGDITAYSGTVFNNGNIQAGDNAIPGSFISFPTGSAAGALILQAQNNSGNYLLFINNASFGQSSNLIIPDPGAASANFILDHGSQTMAAGSKLLLDTGNATVVSQTCTLNKQVGVITTESLTLATAATYTFTINNSLAQLGVPVFVSLSAGSNTVPLNCTVAAKCAIGQINVILANNSASSLNGTLIVNFSLL